MKIAEENNGMYTIDRTSQKENCIQFTGTAGVMGIKMNLMSDIKKWMGYSDIERSGNVWIRRLMNVELWMDISRK